MGGGGLMVIYGSNPLTFQLLNILARLLEVIFGSTPGHFGPFEPSHLFCPWGEAGVGGGGGGSRVIGPKQWHFSTF